MACRKGESGDKPKSKNDAAASVAAVGDALLFTMMCIIGMPVDVHAKDGSVYSGIFFTASVIDEDYAIVLKKATMVKKGNLDANVVNGNLIETLIVRSEDLVQVVAKGVLLPSSGITGYRGENGIEATAGYNECLHMDAEVVKPNKSRGNKKHKSQSRLSVKRYNSSTVKAEDSFGSFSGDHIERFDATNIVQVAEAHNVSVDGRHAQGSSEEIQTDGQNNLEIQDKGTSDGIRGSILTNDTMHQEPQGVSSGYSDAHEDLDRERATSYETACTVATPSNVSVASTPIVDVKSESCLSASSTPYSLVPPKSSSVKGTAKESKLNPGAKMFSPSMLHHRTVTPPVVPNGASDSYTTVTYAMTPMATAQEEVDGSCFARSSVPYKFVQYSDVAFGRGGNDPSYVQPINGQVVNRSQPVRYAGQYQNFQTGHYVHPNPQNVMVGRVGPLVCMHPISSDVVQSVAGFSPAAARPVFTPHQVHLPKHQGNASAQALQICMNPPIMANGPQAFVMPTSIPISQSVFPVLRPIAVPGTNGFLSTKFA